MKKFLFMALLAGIMASRTRTELVKVDNVSVNLVTFETASGHLFQVDNTGRYETEKTAKVVFFDSFTPENVTDDIIIFDE